MTGAFPDANMISRLATRGSALLAGLLLTSLALAQSPAPTEVPDTTKPLEVNNAATVALVEGEVAIFNAAKQKRTVKVGDTLVEGDAIVTGKDGELHLNMEDGGYMAIRPNTRMRIVKYQANGDDNDSGVVSLLQGSFRSVTGWIGKLNRDKYLVRTPHATIGIRGTDHEPLVIPPGSAEGDAGTYDKVNIGGSYIQTDEGRAEVEPNRAGFVPHGAKGRPRILQNVPRWFRATRNEHLLKGKHEQVQKLIEHRRELRRKEIIRRLETRKAMAQRNHNPAAEKKLNEREAQIKAREEARERRKKAQEEAGR